MDSVTDLLAEHERRILMAASRTPARRPWIEDDRAAILDTAGTLLGIRDSLVPEISAETVSVTSVQEIAIEKLTLTSWPHCYGSAYLYLPGTGHSPLPLVILCCGHGGGGKRFSGYREMAWRLAQSGVAVLVPDNIGQGERTAMGHADVVVPFQVGLSLQGMIVMETMAWLNWCRADRRFDGERIAAIGNSGGGVLTLFLGAMCRDKLAALSSSGYPSTFEFIARKEKKFCHCNLLPGVVGKLEMWQLYGCFAPKPLFLFQGRHDNMFPQDLFYGTARKVAEVYGHCGAEPAFRWEIFPGEHSWDTERCDAVANFLEGALAIQPPEDSPADVAPDPGDCFDGWPADALTTDAVAKQISGKRPEPAEKLWDVFTVPPVSPEPVTAMRGDPRQVLAQFNAFVSGNGACE